MSFDIKKAIKTHTRKERLEESLRIFKEIHALVFDGSGYDVGLQYEMALGYLDSVVNEES